MLSSCKTDKFSPPPPPPPRFYWCNDILGNRLAKSLNWLGTNCQMLLTPCHSLVKQRENLSNLSSMRCSASSPDETLRRELKIRRAAEYFWWTSRCFIWWWNTVTNAWYYFFFKHTRHILNSLKDLRIHRIVNNDFLWKAGPCSR